MTKAEIRELNKALQFAEAGLGADYLARALSALYRASRSAKTKTELIAVAVLHQVNNNPEFII